MDMQSDRKSGLGGQLGLVAIVGAVLVVITWLYLW